MFECGSDSAVEAFHIFVAGQSLAVRRVHHDEWPVGLLSGFEFFQANLSEFDISRHARGFDIFLGLLNGVERSVRTIYFVRKLAFLAIVVVDFAPEIGVEIGPFLEGKSLAEDARRDISCDQRGLDGQSAGTAHRVVEIGLSSPSGYEQHTCCKCLIDRRFGVGDAVTAFVQTLAATVQADGYLLVGNVYVDEEVGFGQFDIGSAVGVLHPIVGNRIFDAVSDKSAIAESVAIDSCVDGESGFRGHIL